MFTNIKRPNVRRADGNGDDPLFSLSSSTKRMIVTAVIILAVIIVIFTTAAFWVNWWWFGSMGYRSVLTTRYLSEAIAFVAAAALAGGVFAVNVVLALRRSRREQQPNRVVRATDRVLVLLAVVGSTVVALGYGLAAASRWETWLLWINGGSFGFEDPVFHRDVGFYVFTLPPVQMILSAATLLVPLTAAAVAAVYGIRLGVNFGEFRAIPSIMRVHMFSLAGVFMLVVALRHVVDNYLLVYSSRGVVFGASYTDVHAVRLANWLLAAAALVIGIFLLVNAFVRRVRLLVGALAAWGVLFLVLGVLAPTAVQQTVVAPSELKRERTYINNNLAMTRSAFALDAVTGRDLNGMEPVGAASLASAPQTIGNVRLWDYRVIRSTYQQLQSFVPYYVFENVDVDRYRNANGEIQQVVLSAREIDQSGLPVNAQTWTNERLVYTHGYGAVVSPVSSVSAQGLPSFLVKQIPPDGSGAYAITQPAIYFGEANLGWVAVNTQQPEFSGLIDTANPNQGSYAGAARGSIKLNNYLTKLMLAADLGDRNLLLSGNLTGDTRVLLTRNIMDRVTKIAPFLEYDADPYMVIADGRLFWVIDAYTSTDRYPHATREGGVNYLRNSVKVVVDAYDGTTTFYRTAEPDPIADAYAKTFSTLFRPVSEVPPSIAAHFRYPERLFNIQSDIYASVHVTDPSAFYNGEDRWAIPQEQVGGQPARMEPYYVTMTLPQETAPEFTLIRPFVPGGRTDRQNMTSWMAGRVGPDGRTSLVVYRFPRQQTVFGPRQIEARIDQEPAISAQITLWNQSGSSVIRGNLLVIPIGQSVLYVLPLYLQATSSTGALPELKRVIVASNDRVVMNETLSGALADLTGSPAPAGNASNPAANTQSPGGTAATVTPKAQQLIQAAVEAYGRGQDALAKKDWT
ncbi:MAG: UPF0182 family membrane protein, partial [Thermomicrobiales bacterium]